MKQHRFVLSVALAAATTVAVAQMTPGGVGQTGGVGQQQPGMGQHIPGMGEPGMGGTSGMPGEQQPTNAKQNRPRVDDQTLERQVQDQLGKRNEFSDVKAEVKDGVVTLSGSVPNKQDRKEARKVVKDIPGVVSVREKLTVHQGGPSASAAPSTVGGVSGAAANPAATNAEQANNTAGSIGGNTTAASGTETGTSAMGQAGASTSTAPSSNPSTRPSQGAAQPSGGSAMQTGTAPGQTSAEGQSSTGQQSTVPAVSGTNEGGSDVTPDASALQGQIQTALHNQLGLTNQDVSVKVAGDTIELTGSVPSGKEKQNARRIAESFAGNRKVVDKVKVGSSQQR